MPWNRSIKMLLPLLLLSSISMYAQEITALKLRKEGNLVHITYNLNGGINDLYTITIFGSHNNYSKPLEHVNGNVGEEIAPGSNMLIIWDAKQDLGEFSGNVNVRVRAKPIPMIQFTNMIGNKTFRRGKSYQLNWNGGARNSKVLLQLYQGGQKILDLTDTKNTGSWQWNLPKNMDLGKEYKIRALSLNRQTMSADFRIGRKIPLLVKILPIVAGIGGLTAILFSGGDKGPDNIVDPFLPK